MARSRLRPEPPRISEPDLPDTFEDVALRRSAEVIEGRVTLAPGKTDAAHSRISESVVEAASVEAIDLNGAILSDVVFEQMSAAELLAREGTWRTVVVRGGRIGTLDLSRGRWDGVVLDGVRIDYLTVAGATLADVEISGCRIGTLDAPGAQLDRVRFVGTTADEVDTRELQSRDLDLRGLDAVAFTDVRALRGATLSTAQVEAHAAAFAAALGVDVQD
ncbi:hypothetical protein [Microbacterium dauci]|uniref:Pentapeptide repeat-containing protein n=1 Tax=Microbacterium dauci TaxID=3048008 RepID=A0ABT6ZH58_9MICO|nr:hypothetical protein [Microbacterium sp. LX3-4]MDJ1115273.1 hypothetical protein [Microbacterium sp. LX3-4]